MGTTDGNRLLPAIAVGAMLVIGALGLALMGPGASDQQTPSDNPYMNTLDGVMTRHGNPVHREELLAAANAATANDDGSSSGGQPAAAPGTRPSGAVSTAGRRFLAMMGDPDIAVLSLSHPQGSYVYSRTQGWLKLDGAEWVPVAWTQLPADLRSRYPAQLYPDGGVKGAPGSGQDDGSASRHGGHASASGHEAGQSALPATAQPVSAQEAAIRYLPAPDLGQSAQ
jgi:hypothetical protein